MSEIEKQFDPSKIENQELFLKEALNEEKEEAFRGGGRSDDPYAIFTTNNKEREFDEDLYPVDLWDDAELEIKDYTKKPEIFNPNEYIDFAGTSRYREVLENIRRNREDQELEQINDIKTEIVTAMYQDDGFAEEQSGVDPQADLEEVNLDDQDNYRSVSNKKYKYVPKFISRILKKLGF